MVCPETLVEKSSASPHASSTSNNSGKLTVSAYFNAKDADTTFQSIDGVSYYVHRKNLECAATAFPLSEIHDDKDNIIQVTEASDILDLLFAFIYPKPTPSVKSLPFVTLNKLAEAAEKYKVYSAMTVCNIYMGTSIQQYPIEVLVYAVKYHNVELLDAAAPVAVRKQLDIIVTALPPDAAIAWVKYYQQWCNAVIALSDAQKRPPSNRCCNCWTSHCLGVLDKIGGKVESLCDLADVFSKPKISCSNCVRNINTWHDQARKICAGIREFSEYLFPESLTIDPRIEKPTGDMENSI